MNLIFSKSGNALFALVLVLSTGVLTMGLLLNVGSQFKKRAIATKSAAFAGSLNSFNLALIADRFRFIGKKLPVWYPETYPTAEEMSRKGGAKSRPRIKVFQEAQKGTVKYFSENRGLVVDISGLGALGMVSSNLSSAIQKGYVGTGEMSKLSVKDATGFMLAPWITWPKSNADKKFLGVSAFQVKFLEYIADKKNPDLAKKLRVAISSVEKDSAVTRNIAELNIDAPPNPQCKLKLKDPLPASVTAASKAKLILETDSITTSIVINADTLSSPQSYVPKPKQTILNLGQFKEVTSKEITVPLTDDPLTVTAIVAGVTNRDSPSKCSVKLILNPLCTLTADPSNLDKDEITQLTLHCQNPVSYTFIDGREVSYNPTTREAKLSYKKKKNKTELVTALAVGPDGGKSRPYVFLSTECKYANPDYKELIQTPGWGTVTYGKKVGPLYRPMIPSTTTPGLVQWTFWNHTVYHDGNDNWPPCPPNSICTLHDNLHDPAILVKQGHNLVYQWFSAVISDATSASCKITKLQFRNGGCFAEDTKISIADGQQKRISELRAGDKVWNPYLRMGIEITKVIKGPELIPLFEVRAGTLKVVVTKGHPFYTDRGWLKTTSLQIGDFLLGKKRPLLVTGIRELPVKKGQVVWNMELDSTFAEGHIVEANGIPTGDLIMQKQLVFWGASN